MEYLRSVIPFGKAWKSILLSVLLINGSALGALTYYRYLRMEQKTDPAYAIVAVVQTTSQLDFLKAGHLAELLDLKVDKKENLFSFDRIEAEKKIKKSIAIKEAVVKKIRPGTIHVALTLREPVALLGNYTNTAFDLEGVLFPLKPYFTPKKIPVVYFEESSLANMQALWGTRVPKDGALLVHELLTKVPEVLGELTTLLVVDLSRANSAFVGQRQILLQIEEVEEKVIDQIPLFLTGKRILRLPVENWGHQLENYAAFRKREKKLFFQRDLHSHSVVVDLRLEDLAFIF